MKRTYCLELLLTWTLWTHTQTPTSDIWVVAPGLVSQAKCEASMREKLDVWKQFKESKFANNSVTFTDNNATMSYFCLPEAEDPRKSELGQAQSQE